MVYNFSWIVPERVGGMARPGRDDLEWLVSLGVTAVVSLTEDPLEPFDGIEILHEPVIDMTPPTLEQLRRLVGFVSGVVIKEGKVVVHCTAGVGRTGTVLAAYLVSEGLNAAEAIAFVRALRPGSIETREQEDIVARFAELIGEE